MEIRGKRGQELSTSTIILLILGVVILVVLVLGFTIGWNKVLPFISTNNVQNIQTACTTACSTNNQYDYCTFPRTLKASDLPQENGQAIKQKDGTCQFFSTAAGYEKYAIAACPGITCPA